MEKKMGKAKYKLSPVRIVEFIVSEQKAEKLINKLNDPKYFQEKYGIFRINKYIQNNPRKDYYKIEIELPIFEEYESALEKIRKLIDDFDIKDVQNINTFTKMICSKDFPYAKIASQIWERHHYKKNFPPS